MCSTTSRCSTIRKASMSERDAVSVGFGQQKISPEVSTKLGAVTSGAAQPLARRAPEQGSNPPMHRPQCQNLLRIISGTALLPPRR